VQLIQPGRDKIHHHALNDPSQDQLSAVAVLSVTATRSGRTSDSGSAAKRTGPSWWSSWLLAWRSGSGVMS